ncbi:MAG: hypothetical protein AAFQ07_00935, partial [Chloroflexota bacterium]
MRKSKNVQIHVMSLALLSIIICFLPLNTINAQPQFCFGVCDIEWSPSNDNLLAMITETGLWLYDANETNNAPVLYEIENPT